MEKFRNYREGFKQPRHNIIALFDGIPVVLRSAEGGGGNYKYEKN